VAKRNSLITQDNNPLADVVDAIAPQGDLVITPKNSNVSRRTYGISDTTCLELDKVFLHLQQMAMTEGYDGPLLRKEVIVEVAIDMLCAKVKDGSVPKTLFNAVVDAQKNR